jgi:hypothetical protein
MHHFLVVLAWVLGLSATTVGALVLIAVVMASIRALFQEAAQTWVPQDVSGAEIRASREGYAHRALVALDIFVNVIVLLGEQGQTISSHAWMAAQGGKAWGKAMTTWLDWIQPNHGQLAASGDLERATKSATILHKYLGV